MSHASAAAPTTIKFLCPVSDPRTIFESEDNPLFPFFVPKGACETTSHSEFSAKNKPFMSAASDGVDWWVVKTQDDQTHEPRLSRGSEKTGTSYARAAKKGTHHEEAHQGVEVKPAAKKTRMSGPYQINGPLDQSEQLHGDCYIQVGTHKYFLAFSQGKLTGEAPSNHLKARRVHLVPTDGAIIDEEGLQGKFKMIFADKKPSMIVQFKDGIPEGLDDNWKLQEAPKPTVVDESSVEQVFDVVK